MSSLALGVPNAKAFKTASPRMSFSASDAGIMLNPVDGLEGEGRVTFCSAYTAGNFDIEVKLAC